MIVDVASELARLPATAEAPWRVRDLPPPAPLAMPVQSFDLAPSRAIVAPTPPVMAWRRGFLLGGSGTIGLVASCGVALPLAVNGFDVVDQAFVLLSLLLFSWLGLGFLNALAGLCCLARTRNQPSSTTSGRDVRDRVAILMPIHNEELDMLEARIAAMSLDLGRKGMSDRFDFFILSDSAPAAEAPERAMCLRLRGPDRPPLHYRRRASNAGRKPGNIADWVRTFGAAYPAMLVLDADSLMSADAMVRLALMLEEDPTLALVQTSPLITGARTLFARWQQFTAALNGSVASAGLNWWSGGEATFWGHNAVLRTRAFAKSCGLPLLTGAEPLGGAILSHDMIEAALLRRRGWHTRMLLLDEGTYEESPPTLVDHAIRDRRWCQGNLQHLRLLDIAGLHWISRVQLLMGASAYLTSPMWLLLLAGGLFQAVRSGTPMADLGTPPWLIALTMILLFGTRTLSLVWAVLHPPLAARLGGWPTILRSVVVDILLAVVAAPAIMASQCQAILEIAGGRPSGWQPQRRRSDGITLGEALDRYRWHMLLGLVFWTVALSELGGGIWNLPVALGLLGAPFLAAITSRADLGAAAARHGVFVTDPGASQSERLPLAPAHGPWLAARKAAAA